MKNNQPQHNEDMQALPEEQLDQVTGGTDLLSMFSALIHPAPTHPAVTHPAPTHPAVTHPAPKTYTVKQGDTLSGIAGKGDWHQLYNKNKSVIGNNPDLIYPGQKINL